MFPFAAGYDMNSRSHPRIFPELDKNELSPGKSTTLNSRRAFGLDSAKPTRCAGEVMRHCPNMIFPQDADYGI